MPHPSFDSLDHRPWPIPARPWAWRQTWHDLLFLHWPVPVAAVRSLVPRTLEIQKFSGTAWVGVIPFWMSGVALRNWPALPGVSRFPELNVRTYVTLEGRPGVWFFSLDAANRLAVWTARRFFHLPYAYARIQVRRTGDQIEYHSARPSGPGFEATYRPHGSPTRTVPGSLAQWFTERYCLYAQARSGQLSRAEIHHKPWPLQQATADVRRNDMLRLHGIDVQGPAPQQHFAQKLEVVVWSPEQVGHAVPIAA